MAGQRASSRIKQKPAMAWQRQLRRVEMSKEDKVMDLKRKVSSLKTCGCVRGERA